MIHRILRLDDYGMFQDWRWPEHGPALQQTSVIYGGNGTGKSTVAAALAAAAAGDEGHTGLVIEVAGEGADSKPRPVASSAREDPVWRRVHVFDRRYVREHLDFDDEDLVSATHLLTLGKPAVDAVNTLRAHRKRIEQIDKQLPDLSGTERQHKKNCDDLARDTASRIAQECGPANDRFAPRRYNASKVRELLKGDQSALHQRRSSNVGADLAIISESPTPTRAMPVWPAIDLDGIEHEATELLTRSVTSTALASLRDDAEASRWVQAGLPLHSARDACLFCDGTISQERRKALTNHFDQSLTDLQSRLGALHQSLEAFPRSLDEAFRELPRETDLAASLHEPYATWLSEAQARVNALKARGMAIRDAIGAKLDQIFSPMSMPGLPDASPIDIEGLRKLIAEHNALMGDLQTRRASAADRVECTRVMDIAERYTTFVDQESSARTERDRLVAERDRLDREIELLEHRDRDPRPLAKELTRELEHLLGRRELAFSPIDGGERYSITRDGQPATRLSEGERTAISLLYFLASLRQDAAADTEADKQIVVVDDPVSSLDSSVLLGASAHLWHRLYKASSVSQVIMLTHSFELLRTWISLLDGDGSIAELRVRTEKRDDATVRVPQLIGWSDKKDMRRRLRSEYHYLFWRVATALIDCKAEDPQHESEMDAVAVLPNAARKMLEGFFSFKSPDTTGNLTKAIKAYSSKSDPASLDAANRYLNQQSHNDQVDLGNGVLITTAVDTLTSVFALMKAVDEGHVRQMCTAVNIPFDQL